MRGARRRSHSRGTTTAIVAALFTLLAIAAFAAPQAEAAKAKKIRKCNGQKILCDRPFDQVVLPAAHNAMSSASLDWVFANQSIAMPDQLTYGIRGFLIDTHYGRLKADGQVVTDDDGSKPPSVGPRGTYLCHEFCEIGATPLAEGLSAFSSFLHEHPNNVLLIDNEDYITPHAFFKAAKQAKLLRYIYKGSTDQWPTLREMIASRQQIVVLADNHGGDAGSPSWYRPTYDGILQETPYSFDPPKQLTYARNWAASCQPNRGGTTGSLFLMNHWSPSTPPPNPNLEQAAHVNARAVIYNRAKKCAEIRGRVPTIVAADQANTGGLLEAVRDLNALIVK